EEFLELKKGEGVLEVSISCSMSFYSLTQFGTEGKVICVGLLFLLYWLGKAVVARGVIELLWIASSHTLCASRNDELTCLVVFS
ncbi:MAG: hypothetical protein LBC96_05500, partial [Lachnospiraceae bacterium]|nr:hypothetical protein [Lachnospiraceae bacterium]